MLTKALPMGGLCLLLLAACSGAPMDNRGGGGSGASGANPTSYGNSYGATSGSSESTWDGQMDWGE